MNVIKLVKNDNLPQVTLTLTDGSTGNAIDLSAATTSVVVRLRAQGSTTVLATLSCTKTNGGGDGVVMFFFPNNTLDVTPGTYEGEIEMNFNGLKQTVYDLLFFTVRADFD